ncbi:TPA: Stp1/IreP family PP2C-type Ser/Thr phosphatase [Candidatus Sumerlaeota bacterium]|nr:Stp1/IreP family PP2C-type Ser/Thr phosphatase [Candidatus Sumerlaeota bacterium]
MRLFSAGLTDKGLRRPGNEDSLVCRDDLGLYMVADGMGGHAAGEVASGTAVEVVTKYVQQSLNELTIITDSSPTSTTPREVYGKIIVDAVLTANEQICAQSAQNSEWEGMGTTISGFLVQGSLLWLAHVGDSRVYRLRGGALEQLTDDHSWVNEQIRRKMLTPEEAKTHRWRNVITRALGHKLDLRVDAGMVKIVPEDIYLICSDGLTGMVDDPLIETILKSFSYDLPSACATLVQKANEAGGIDNITVILLKAAGE